MRRVQQAARNGFFLQLPREFLNGICGTRDHALFGPVDRGECQFFRKREHIGSRGNRQHRTGWHLSHQAASNGAQVKTIFKREHTRQASGRVLSDAVADHCGRGDSARHPPLRQRIFNAEQRGLRKAGVG